MSDRLLVLGWHNVAGTHAFPSAAGAGERGFRQQMGTLARVANVLELQDALAHLRAGEPLPSRAVSITFDDGYRDNLALAVPVLERLGLPATFFLVPRLLSREVDAWWETVGWAVDSTSRASLRWEEANFALDGTHSRRNAYSQIVKRLKLREQAAREAAVAELLDTLEPPGTPPVLFMDWDDARQLVGRGFSVQSHTSSHPVLAQEHSERQRSELADGRGQLEERLGVSITTVAYPHGGEQDYSRETTAIAAQCGYSWGVTTHEGFTTSATAPLEIRRCVVYPERGNLDLLAQLRYIFKAWRLERRT